VTYCTLAQLTDRYGEPMLIDLTDRDDPPTGAVVTEVVDRALADTDALIDGYLAGRYALPLAETPALVTDVAQAIAIYQLHRSVASDKVTADHNGALATLRAIAKGDVRLSVAGAEPSASDSGKVVTNDPARPMTADTMKGFI